MKKLAATKEIKGIINNNVPIEKSLLSTLPYKKIQLMRNYNDRTSKTR